MFATERRPGWMALALAMAVLPIAAEARDRAKVIPLASVETGTATGLGAGLGAVEVRSPEPRAAEVRSGFEARGLHATGVTGDVTVVVDRAKIIRLPEKAQTIVIGNPAVADISVQKNGVVVLTGKSFGVTNFIAMDSAGNQIAEAKVSVTAPSDATLLVQRGLERQTYSCAPTCLPTVQLGDSQTYFGETKGQVDAHTAFTGQR
jgi:Flp pilus assembly secretin CpaC